MTKERTLTRWHEALILTVGGLVVGCDRGAPGPSPAGDPVDVIIGEIESSSSQLSAVIRAHRDLHGAWPTTLSDLEKTAKEREIAFDGDIYEWVKVTARPDGSVKVDYATRLRRTATGTQGPGTGSLTLPGK